MGLEPSFLFDREGSGFLGPINRWEFPTPAMEFPGPDLQGLVFSRYWHDEWHNSQHTAGHSHLPRSGASFSQMLNVWTIYLHLGSFDGKCR